jgi:hypothetical protein
MSALAAFLVAAVAAVGALFGGSGALLGTLVGCPPRPPLPPAKKPNG